MDFDTQAVTLPITRVTCLEDRAQVERRGDLTLAAGIQRLTLAGMSPVAVDRSLQIEASGAAVVHAAIVRQSKARPPGGLPADASALRRRVHELEREAARCSAAHLRKQARLEIFQAAHVDALRGIAESAGAGKADVLTWRAQLAQLRADVARAERELRELVLEEDRLAQQLRDAAGVLATSEQAEQVTEATLTLTLDVSTAGPVMLRISYLVPCGVWRPAYRATLVKRDAASAVQLELEAVVWQRTGEAWKDVELLLSTGRPTLGATPPHLVDDLLTLRPRLEAEKRAVDVSVREEVIQTTGTRTASVATEMPGLDDGGQVQVLRVPRHVSIPEDGQPHRVQLGGFEAPAQLELLCAPEFAPVVSWIARFDNRGAHVLLAGPVDLVRESGFVGKGQLRFAAVGETVKLSFGSEDHLRVGRKVESKHDESRLTGRRLTQRSVRLFVSNMGGSEARLSLEERIPVSEVKEVEISLLKKETTPAPARVSEDGIVRFELNVPAKGQTEVVLAYQVSADSKVTGLLRD